MIKIHSCQIQSSVHLSDNVVTFQAREILLCKFSVQFSTLAGNQILLIQTGRQCAVTTYCTEDMQPFVDAVVLWWRSNRSATPFHSSELNRCVKQAICMNTCPVCPVCHACLFLPLSSLEISYLSGLDP